MPDAQLVFLSPAWRDLDRISDLHMMLAETKSAEEIRISCSIPSHCLQSSPTWGPCIQILFWLGISIGS